MSMLSDPEMFNEVFDRFAHSAWILEDKADRETIFLEKFGGILADFIPRRVSILPTAGQALLAM